MKKKLLYIITFLLVGILSLNAQDEVVFRTICKKQVSVGEQFQVSYELNADGNDFKTPNFTNFEVIGGPFKSTSSSVQIINGAVSRTNIQTYSFHLRAIKEGKFNIPQASITVDKKRITSEPCEINVIKSANGNSSYSTTNNTQERDTSKDVYLEATTNKKKVYLGEQLILSYKLLYRLPVYDDISIIESPSYSGFWTKNLTKSTGNNISKSSTIRDGLEYEVATLQEIVMFPQKTGNLVIDPLDISCYVQIKQQKKRSNTYDPFESFYNDILGTSYTKVRKEVKSQPITIEVMPLPVENKPESFKGAVGQFTFTAKIDKNELKVNEGFTLTLTVSGKGNIELLELPQPVFPPDFEDFAPKITTSLKDNATGISGSKKAEYIVIPRVAGDFSLEDIKFSYFNPSLGRYETLSSGEQEIHVLKGEGSSNTAGGIYTPGQTDIKYLGKDIQHINTSNNSLSITGLLFFMSHAYMIILIAMIVIFIVAMIVNKRINKFNKNQVLVKNKQATKVAKKRLLNAHNHLKSNNQNGFYEELSQALWGYISDKLNIVRSQLSMDTVREIMLSKNVDEEIVSEFIDLLNSCEFARFAPGDPSKKMDELYQKGIDLITKAEKVLK